VRQRGLRVFVHETAGRDQVPGYPFGVAGVQPTQSATDRRIQVLGVDPLGDVRTRRQGRLTIGAIVPG
jgi:hypothetical protein